MNSKTTLESGLQASFANEAYRCLGVSGPNGGGSGGIAFIFESSELLSVSGDAPFAQKVLLVLGRFHAMIIRMLSSPVWMYPMLLSGTFDSMHFASRYRR